MATKMNLPVIVVPGTFWKDVASWAETYSLSNKPMQAIAKVFGSAPILFEWSGANSAGERHAAADKLVCLIQNTGSRVHLLGFSHGGNIACEAAAKSASKVDLLVTIATPVTGNYKTGGARRHIHLYSPQDRMQLLGGEGPLGIPAFAAREFPGATNVAIHNIPGSDITGSHGNILWSDETWRILETLH
jgi:pimeloyl-ACP methyl ester carboxylesterase